MKKRGRRSQNLNNTCGTGIVQDSDRRNDSNDFKVSKNAPNQKSVLVE